jgi:hypothetical protein
MRWLLTLLNALRYRSLTFAPLLAGPVLFVSTSSKLLINLFNLYFTLPHSISMQLPRRSVRSIQELPSIHTAFAIHYQAVRTHSASTASNSARSPDIEDGLEVVPLERDSILSAPIVSAYLDEKEVFISTQELSEKPLPNPPTSLWGRTWGRMSVKYRVLAVLGLQALVLFTVGMVLLATSPKHTEKYDVYLDSRESVS